MSKLSELQRQLDRIDRQIGRSTDLVSVDGTTTRAPNLADQLKAREAIKEEIELLQAKRPWNDLVMVPPGPIGDFS